jgi:hypothetical protein
MRPKGLSTRAEMPVAKKPTKRNADAPWRTHSCVLRRDSSRRWAGHRHEQSMQHARVRAPRDVFNRAGANLVPTQGYRAGAVLPNRDREGAGAVLPNRDREGAGAVLPNHDREGAGA